ncbi:hypothetical protein [Mesorhizobium sp. 1B3]|uniref:hypothetical protein n=1 Tax=Mesorhizobium sp. 1B3 TaxID=3243599 RepID=UPI003D9770EE
MPITDFDHLYPDHRVYRERHALDTLRGSEPLSLDEIASRYRLSIETIRSMRDTLREARALDVHPELIRSLTLQALRHAITDKKGSADGQTQNEGPPV